MLDQIWILPRPSSLRAFDRQRARQAGVVEPGVSAKAIAMPAMTPGITNASVRRQLRAEGLQILLQFVFQPRRASARCMSSMLDLREQPLIERASSDGRGGFAAACRVQRFELGEALPGTARSRPGALRTRRESPRSSPSSQSCRRSFHSDDVLVGDDSLVAWLPLAAASRGQLDESLARTMQQALTVPSGRPRLSARSARTTCLPYRTT